MRFLGIGLALALAVPGLARAQSTNNPYNEQMRAAAALQPAPQSPLSSAQRIVDFDVATQREFNSRAPGATLMIIGGAGLIVGALLGGSGGTLLMLAGVGVGAYGVYLYTQ